MCQVKDDCEERSQINSGNTANLFLRSPINAKLEEENPIHGLSKGKSRNKMQLSLLSSLLGGTLGMTINSSSIGRVSRTKESVHRLLSLNSLGTAYQDETCAANSSDEEASARHNGLRSHAQVANTLQMSGVSRKGQHTSRSVSPLPRVEFHSSEKVRPLRPRIANNNNCSDLRLASEVALG